jgi:hypothetical protein
MSLFATDARSHRNLAIRQPAEIGHTGLGQKPGGNMRRRMMMVTMLWMACAAHAGESAIPDSFKTYKRVDLGGAPLYVAGTIVPRVSIRKMDLDGGTQDVVHASFETNKINFTIFFDPGPSNDPTYEVTATRAEKTHRISLLADRLFVSGEGALYTDGTTDRDFNFRQKFTMDKNGFHAVPQPYHLVDMECSLQADVSLTSEPCGRGQIVAFVPQGSKIHVLVAPLSASCPGGEGSLSFLVNTSFGLVGWAETRSGNFSPGTPLGCITFRGDWEGAPTSSWQFWSAVSNIAELWGSLKDKAEVMLPPQDMAYQMREFGIKDPNGYALMLGEDISKK